MTTTFLSDTKPVAMKKHRCEWCGESIDVGEKHHRFVHIFEGDFQCYRLHFECYHMMDCMRSDNHIDIDDGFEPYRNRRGKKPEEIVAARLRGDSEWRY